MLCISSIQCTFQKVYGDYVSLGLNVHKHFHSHAHSHHHIRAAPMDVMFNEGTFEEKYARKFFGTTLHGMCGAYEGRSATCFV